MPKNGLVQWGWSEMEDLLQCPVCLDIPAVGVVEQCRHGHHICVNCKKQLDSCPLCKCDFHGTRNFVVEELVRHYEILKNTMLLNNITTEPKPQKKTKAKHNAGATVFVPNPRERKFNTPDFNKGSYPCRVTDCNVTLPAGRMLNHVRTCHTGVLTEAVVDLTDGYHQTWEIMFKNKQPVNTNCFVIFIRGIGLIFLTIEILHSGQLVLVVQAAMKFRFAQNFLACVELFNNNITYSYNTRLLSVRENIQGLMQKRLCFTLNKNQLKRICINKTFKCKMRLSRFNDLDSNILTVPHIDQINIIAAKRASLIQEQNDNKLVKELEKCTSKGVANRSNGPNKFITEQQPVQSLGHHKVKLSGSLQTSSMNLQRHEVAVNGNSSREVENVGVSFSNASRCQIRVGRGVNRNRRNRRGFSINVASNMS